MRANIRRFILFPDHLINMYIHFHLTYLIIVIHTNFNWSIFCHVYLIFFKESQFHYSYSKYLFPIVLFYLFFHLNECICFLPFFKWMGIMAWIKSYGNSSIHEHVSLWLIRGHILFFLAGYCWYYCIFLIFFWLFNFKFLNLYIINFL